MKTDAVRPSVESRRYRVRPCQRARSHGAGWERARGNRGTLSRGRPLLLRVWRFARQAHGRAAAVGWYLRRLFLVWRSRRLPDFFRRGAVRPRQKRRYRASNRAAPGGPGCVVDSYGRSLDRTFCQSRSFRVVVWSARYRHAQKTSAQVRASIGTHSRPLGTPSYSARGRIKRLLLYCSRMWAVQPDMRLTAKIGVKRSTGIPNE